MLCSAEGATVISPGLQPWVLDVRQAILEPRRPSGLGFVGAIAFPGLKPWATDGRPYGAARLRNASIYINP